jgi:hypothetical protein
MKARSLTLSIAAIVGAFSLFATSAEAGDGRKKRYYRGGNDYGYYRGGGNDYGYYQPRRYYRPRYVRYYQPYYYQPPFFQIGFAFGGNRNCR